MTSILTTPLFADPRRLLLEMARERALPDLLRLAVEPPAAAPRGARAGLHGLAAGDRRRRRGRHRHRPRLRADRGAVAPARAGERVPARGGHAGRRLWRADWPRSGAGGPRPPDRPGGPDRRGRA